MYYYETYDEDDADYYCYYNHLLNLNDVHDYLYHVDVVVGVGVDADVAVGYTDLNVADVDGVGVVDGCYYYIDIEEHYYAYVHYYYCCI